jgi:thiamine biosynthesis lipoprotein
VAIVELHDASLSTSGDYERYFEQDGVRYHHILDPHTGLPARGLRSATVIAPNATDADALSTAVMVLGAEKGLELIASLPGTEALLVDDTGGVLVSPGLKPFMTSVPTAP